MSATSLGLFSPIELRGLTVANRVWVPPMCQYSVMAEDGVPTEWHLVHLGSRAVGGFGLIISEATAVEARGRISPQDIGLWNDESIPMLRRITGFLQQHGAVAAVQLAHAGRKARVPGLIAPSALAYAGMPAPQAMGATELSEVRQSFRQAAQRALRAGFQCAELHAAHGYLLHEFLSPLSNLRTDGYGGSFVNRIRFLLEVVDDVRAVWPADLPLLVRISATDWVAGGWDLDQSVALTRELQQHGVDLMDVSSGGLSAEQQVALAPGYQVPFAARIRAETGMPVAAVGLINDAAQANLIVASGQADAVLLGRLALRDPYWPIRASRELGQECPIPVQYQRGWTS